MQRVGRRGAAARAGCLDGRRGQLGEAGRQKAGEAAAPRQLVPGSPRHGEVPAGEQRVGLGVGDADDQHVAVHERAPGGLDGHGWRRQRQERPAGEHVVGAALGVQRHGRLRADERGDRLDAGKPGLRDGRLGGRERRPCQPGVGRIDTDESDRQRESTRVGEGSWAVAFGMARARDAKAECYQNKQGTDGLHGGWVST